MSSKNNLNNEQDSPIKKLRLYRVLSKATVGVYRIVNQSTFFPEFERKNKLRRYYENYKWLFSYRRINSTYNSFGLDIKNFTNVKDYLDLKDMRKQKKTLGIITDDDIDSANLLSKFSLLADDKFVFYTYFNSIKPGITPNVLLVFTKNKLLWPCKKYNNVKDFLLQCPSGKYICKASTGMGGHSISLIEKTSKGILINNKTIDIDNFLKSLDNSTYIIQEYVNQHKNLAKFNSSTLNTIRIISVRFRKDTNFLGAMLRLGVDKNQIVDNASSGGTFVGIDIETGKLKEYGYFFDAKRTSSHPTSKIKYKDYQIPYWKETLDLIKELHPFVYGLPSIGWDIAITEDGPQVIEINTDWGTKGLQIANGGLKARWEELKKK